MYFQKYFHCGEMFHVRGLLYTDAKRLYSLAILTFCWAPWLK